MPVYTGLSNFLEDISSLSSISFLFSHKKLFLSLLRCLAYFSPVAIPGGIWSWAGPNSVPSTEKSKDCNRSPSTVLRKVFVVVVVVVVVV